MGGLSLSHWIVVLVVLLLFFGPSKLPGLGASLGKAIRGFKDGLNDADPETPVAPTQRAEQIAPSQNQAQTQQTQTNKEPQDRS